MALNKNSPNTRYPDDGFEDDDNVFDVDQAEDDYANEYDDAHSSPEQAQASPRREFKYSTADMNEQSKCRKYCMIFLLFLAMMAFMIGLSMLLKHFFFSDVSDNAPQYPERNANDTFPLDKTKIDQACSTGTFEADNGQRCRDTCVPQFFECCDPFDEFNLYNITIEEVKPLVNVNDTLPTGAPTTFAFGLNQTERLANCSLDTELRGCMAYAKCQALGQQIEPARSTLPILCSKANLEVDPVSCQELCKPVKCCYSAGNDNCMADDLDICMDYAPCQNLRESITLETAPDGLDEACFWQKPECAEFCEKAKCCGDSESSCFQDNFLTCLTYAPCQGVTRTEIVVAPQFSVVSKPPVDLVAACEEHHQLTNGSQQQQPTVDPYVPVSCADLCETARCCWESNAVDNCFFEDPLGCLAWEQQCQVLFE
jgi:hypothetical protein